MGKKLNKPVFASELASWLQLDWSGKDVLIESITALSSPAQNSLCFANHAPIEKLDFSCALISKDDAEGKAEAVLKANNPRLVFAKALAVINEQVGFIKSKTPAEIHSTANVSSHAFVEPGVKIGARTLVMPFAYIGSGTVIGSDCIIKSGAVIGQDGFGFERDENGIPIRLQHLGNVVIGNNVEIGSLNTVCKGTLDDTIIGDNIKTDDHVHIAHNVRIGSGTLLTACVEISGGVEIGKNVWIGPNSSLMQKIKIGNDAFIGIASNVIKDIPELAVVAGNPARVLRIKN